MILPSVQQYMETVGKIATDLGYWAVKNAQREFWTLGADLYLSGIKGYETSAWMLKHSLQDNPYDIYRDNNSRIAYLINTDSAYLEAVDQAIASSDGQLIDTEISVEFSQGDLYYSIHKSDIRLKGFKREDGSWLIKANLEDDYDFTEIQSFMKDDGGASMQAGLGTIANDVAAASQKTGAIVPYKVYVEFYTTR